MKNYYQVLGVSASSSFDEIKTAYRKLAKKYHPDKNFGDPAYEEQFKLIQEAYWVLSDTEEKYFYDLKLYKHLRSRKEVFYADVVEDASMRQPWIILGIVLISGFLAWFIYDSEETLIPKIKAVPAFVEVNNRELTQKINNADSPYDYFFKSSMDDENSKNSVTIINSNNSCAVVCLAKKGHKDETIRNEFLYPGVAYKINHIPNGTYYLKVYYGNNWNYELKLNNTIKGGFEKDTLFQCYNQPENLLKMYHGNSGQNSFFTSYEITINSYLIKENQKITSREFFR